MLLLSPDSPISVDLEYKDLRARCIARAQEYRISNIADSFLKEYETGLGKLKNNSNPPKVGCGAAS